MMYKKRLKPGDLDDVSEEDQAKMRAICEQRTEELQRLYRTACDVSF
jgi:hypothetical protein